MNEAIQFYLNELLDIVIIILIVVAIRRILPALSQFMITKVIDKLVKAAEQTIKGSSMGAEKKEWVLAQLEKLGVRATEMINTLVEAAVYELNATKEQIEAKRGL